ncbi:MAG: HAD family hydrolase [Ruminococcaceae bacterium]|nr:HAD family hydrolase [Oscillospiraceae bacterium]
MIKAVLIDIDNTLLDFDAYVREAMRDGFEKFGLPSYRDEMYGVFLRVNTEFWHRLERGEITYGELLRERWNCIFSALGISFDGPTFEAYFKSCLFDSAIPVEGAAELLEYLKGRYILCAASNGPYRQQINRLEKGGLLPYFSECFISEQIGASKPSAAFFSRCMDTLNRARAEAGEEALFPSEVMMIGDSLTSDIAGAIGSGIETCFFNRDMRPLPQDLSIDHVVYTLEEIRRFL